MAKLDAGVVRRRRTPLRIAVFVAAVAAVGLPLPHAAQASCLGPSIAVGTAVDVRNPPTSGGSLIAGQRVTVTGEWFRSGCDDTGASAVGCSTGSGQRSTEAPLTEVQLVLRQGQSRWTIDTRDAAGRSDRYAVAWQGRIPKAARPGPAELMANTAILPVLISN